MFLPSGVQYQLKYDGFGNLAQLITPNNQLHRFDKSISLGFVRSRYMMPADSSASLVFIQDVNNAGQVIRQIYPSSYR